MALKKRAKTISWEHRINWKLFAETSVMLWQAIPLSFETKERVKNLVFPIIAGLIKQTEVYRVWLVRRDMPIKFCPKHDLPELDLSEKVSTARTEPFQKPPARLIAFYLPQFHQIPENDAWWGKGFTEWTNVRRGVPYFCGHYQPHEPGEFGYYDLVMQPEIMARQTQLAQFYGISGFCFYFYWSNGRRLLHSPIEQYINNSNISFSFCFCWANENWTRRWDGREKEILFLQEYSKEDDIKLIECLSSYFLDNRYIRVKGKPLILIYRPELLPAPRETTARWRKWCQEKGFGEIYLAFPQSFMAIDPAYFGFDAALEFPPNNTAPPIITNSIVGLSNMFKGIIYDWTALAKRSECYTIPTYKLFRGVCPSWDNTPRSKNRSTIFYGSSPRRYQKWLENAITDTISRFTDLSERLVFINAWNEWAEGAYLEPDNRYGYAFLEATANALEVTRNHVRKKIIYVCHDANFNGAQLLSLNIIKVLHLHFGYEVHLILLEHGPLTAEFERYASIVHFDKNLSELELYSLIDNGAQAAIASTSVVGYLVEVLNKSGVKVVTLVHEMPNIIKEKNLIASIQKIYDFSDKIVFPAKIVLEKDAQLYSLNPTKVVIRPQGLYHNNPFKFNKSEARKTVRSEFGLADDSVIVLAVAYGDYRKGVDLFVDVAAYLVEKANWYFVWIGLVEPNMYQSIQSKFRGKGGMHRTLFVGERQRPELYFAAADVYLLTSREDPFPSSVLAAMDVGVPVVAFRDSGGCSDLLQEQNGVLVPYLDTLKMAAAVESLIFDKDYQEAISENSRKIIEKDFRFLDYVYDLLYLIGNIHFKVSVIIPNYNYSRYLQRRIQSIITQSVKPYEIIFLDDCSTDDSLSEAERQLQNSNIEYRIVKNEQNEGIYFQWFKGLSLSKGEIVWIAEADDFVEVYFLEKLLVCFQDESVVMAYCQSVQVDENDQALAADYLEYTNDISTEKWRTSYLREGVDELSDSLVIKNTIPNVSGVLMRRPQFDAVKEQLLRFKFAGDWFAYAHVLLGGKIFYLPDSLNYHRRHTYGAIAGANGLDLMKEIINVQCYILERITITDNIEAKRRSYLQQLYEQLLLKEKRAMNYEMHPDLAGLERAARSFRTSQ